MVWMLEEQKDLEKSSCRRKGSSWRGRHGLLTRRLMHTRRAAEPEGTGEESVEKAGGGRLGLSGKESAGRY